MTGPVPHQLDLCVCVCVCVCAYVCVCVHHSGHNATLFCVSCDCVLSQDKSVKSAALVSLYRTLLISISDLNTQKTQQSFMTVKKFMTDATFE